MARPSKGDRTYHMVTFHPAALARLAEKAAEAGVASLSQYGADVLALYVGMPEHVRELNKTPLLPLTQTGDAAPQGDKQGGRLMIRPLREVTERLVSQAFGPISPYIADILTVHVGMPELVRTKRAEEVLPLAM